MLKCKKCGAELADGQRACIECGETTVAGGKFDYGEEKHFELTRNHIYAIAGVVLLVIIVLIARGLRTVPPDKVAGEWFDAMVGRQFNIAQKLSTDNVSKDLSQKGMDLRSIADEYRLEISDNRATYQVAQPVFDDPSSPKSANLAIQITYADGTPGREVQVQMVKVGRQWRVDRIM